MKRNIHIYARPHDCYTGVGSQAVNLKRLLEGLGHDVHLKKSPDGTSEEVRIVVGDPWAVKQIIKATPPTTKLVWWHVLDDSNVWLRGLDELYNRCDHVACISRAALRRCPKDTPHKSYAPHFFMEEQAPFRKRTEGGPTKYLWVNRYQERKKLGALLAMWDTHRQHFPEDTLRVHSYNLRPNMAKDISEMHNVTATRGFAPEEKIVEMHQAADVCLSTSSSEGFGLSTLRHMLMGGKVVAPEGTGEEDKLLYFRDQMYVFETIQDKVCTPMSVQYPTVAYSPRVVGTTLGLKVAELSFPQEQDKYNVMTPQAQQWTWEQLLVGLWT